MQNERVYEWDESKAASNLNKHGVEFDAVNDFDWANADMSIDDRHDYGEERLLAIGPCDQRIVVVSFTMRENKTRIISLRKANNREIKRWRNG